MLLGSSLPEEPASEKCTPPLVSCNHLCTTPAHIVNPQPQLICLATTLSLDPTPSRTQKCWIKYLETFLRAVIQNWLAHVRRENNVLGSPFSENMSVVREITLLHHMRQCQPAGLPEECEPGAVFTGPWNNTCLSTSVHPCWHPQFREKTTTSYVPRVISSAFLPPWLTPGPVWTTWFRTTSCVSFFQ